MCTTHKMMVNPLAQAVSEIKDSDIDDQTFVTIRASH